MKKLFQTTLFLTTGLLLLASCNSSTKNGTKSLPYLEKPTPNPTPHTYSTEAIFFSVVDPVSGKTVEGKYEFNKDTKNSSIRLNLFKLERFRSSKIIYNLISANIGFIKEDHSLLKGCQSRLETEKNRQQLLLEAENETNAVIKADLLEMAQFDFELNKKELELEAAYIQLSSLLEFPDSEFRELSRQAMHNKLTDFTEKDMLEHAGIFFDLKDFEFSLKDSNLTEYYKEKWAHNLSDHNASAAGTSHQMRVSNGFLCDLLLGQVELNVINSNGDHYPIKVSSDE